MLYSQSQSKQLDTGKKKRPGEHTIHDILRKERNLIEVKLVDINDRLAFLLKEGKIKNQPSNGKNPYFILENNPDTSHESISETDNGTPTTTTCPCETHCRGGCRGLPLLPMQHPEMADINFQS